MTWIKIETQRKYFRAVISEYISQRTRTSRRAGVRDALQGTDLCDHGGLASRGRGPWGLPPGRAGWDAEHKLLSAGRTSSWGKPPLRSSGLSTDWIKPTLDYWGSSPSLKISWWQMLITSTTFLPATLGKCLTDEQERQPRRCPRNLSWHRVTHVSSRPTLCGGCPESPHLCFSRWRNWIASHTDK